MTAAALAAGAAAVAALKRSMTKAQSTHGRPTSSSDLCPVTEVALMFLYMQNKYKMRTSAGMPRRKACAEVTAFRSTSSLHNLERRASRHKTSRSWSTSSDPGVPAGEGAEAGADAAPAAAAAGDAAVTVAVTVEVVQVEVAVHNKKGALEIGSVQNVVTITLHAIWNAVSVASQNLVMTPVAAEAQAVDVAEGVTVAASRMVKRRSLFQASYEPAHIQEQLARCRLDFVESLTRLLKWIW